MGGKAKKRREKNYLAAHGGNNRLPPPPNTSSIDALPSKLRKILSFASSPVPANQGSAIDSKNTQKKSKKVDNALNKPHSKSEVDGKSKGTKGEKVKKSTVPQEKVSTDANEEKNKKKRKRKQANDLRFEAEMEKLDGVSTRKQRKKEFLKAKKKKQKKGSSEQILDLPKHDIVKFGEVAEAPPKLPTIPAFRKAMSASNERLRLQAIEAYRKRKGWTNRPGIHLPPVSTSPDLL
ncbi:H/ACA ribonucleoprotein complex subunit 4-like [Chenopodium quinoa]|uniref:H/ACA ribonucleoprotein complex subunit 4-like n=1 Tax=Chenopodium quinoa TaxID=63459 RepID=UPI000B779395|nr:H/ACA ribonucleoprotein complex subunit 4-like [Chenopodium quinoa]